MLKPASPKPNNDAPAGKRYAAAGRKMLRYVERGLAIFGAIVGFYWLTMDYAVVISPSMAPTLVGTNPDDGDRVITEKVTRWFRRPRRWEVITFISDIGDKRMKRVVALPGETVQMDRSGELLVDGKPVEFPPSLDLKYLKFGNLVDGHPIPCGDGYYVLGDDLKDSDDSRFNGPVPPQRIVGRAWLIVGPTDRFGWVR
ncbi:signal peptidase I [Blastopirellula retiformator]|uniref:Signal peptidase I n=1 Tax=Blastopirellula retiformator TaxID=2527970 RepID=A0A5C5V6I1_9BACT|nr:signal peptidase I [Blastopirellula retiformator]TWT33417.1 Signal peptidase I V [Blastopirellula retiformator]